MNHDEPAHKTNQPTADCEEITAEFPIYTDPDKVVVVDEVPGRPGDALVDVRRRIQETVFEAGRS